MSRSKWKGPHNASEQLRTIAPRNIVITPHLKGLTFKIHNGKNYREITITDAMIGHKFGEFAFTRVKFSFTDKKAKKLKKQQNKKKTTKQKTATKQKKTTK